MAVNTDDAASLAPSYRTLSNVDNQRSHTNGPSSEKAHLTQYQSSISTVTTETGTGGAASIDATSDYLSLVERSDPLYSGESTLSKTIGFMRGKKEPRTRRKFSASTLTKALETAAQEGNLPILKGILDYGANPNYSTGGKHPTHHRALEYAVVAGHSAVVDCLIERGADHTAVNAALIHAILAQQVMLATRLIVKHKANVDSTIYKETINPQWGAYAEHGGRSVMEYITPLTAAARVTDDTARFQLVDVLIKEECNVNANIIKVYQLKEKLSPRFPHRVGRHIVREEAEGFYGIPRIVHNGFIYSPLACFVSICATTVKLLLQAGATATTPREQPSQGILDAFKCRGYPCQDFVTVQPASCITSELWSSVPDRCLEIAKALAQHSADLSINEYNGYEEKHGWRRGAWGYFEERWSPSTVALTPLHRAKAGHSQAGTEYLASLGLQDVDVDSKADAVVIELPSYE